MLDYFQRNFGYNDWANVEAARSLMRAEQPPEKCLQYLAHMVAAEWLWLERLRGGAKKVIIWPQLSLRDCAESLPELRSAWIEFLNGLSAAGLQRQFSYHNSKGEAWTNTVEDVLTHVLLHSAAHRGQIASTLRAAGATPAYTDYIHAVRQNLV